MHTFTDQTVQTLHPWIQINSKRYCFFIIAKLKYNGQPTYNADSETIELNIFLMETNLNMIFSLCNFSPLSCLKGEWRSSVIFIASNHTIHSAGHNWREFSQTKYKLKLSHHHYLHRQENQCSLVMCKLFTNTMSI